MGNKLKRQKLEKKKSDKPCGFVALVPHIRVELMIFCVRGRCPGPLDECGSLLKAGAKVHTFFILTKYFLQISYTTMIVSMIFFRLTTAQGSTTRVWAGAVALNSGAYMHCMVATPVIKLPGLVTYTSYSK